MITGTTKSGFTYEVEESALDNWEILELLADTTRDDNLKAPPFARLLLGVEQKNALVEHVRGKNGVPKTSDMQRELEEILGAISASKNS